MQYFTARAIAHGASSCLVLWTGLWVLMGACGQPQPAASGVPAVLTYLAFEVADNPQLSAAAVGRIEAAQVSVSVPAGTNVTALVPTLQHTGADVQPPSRFAQDFRQPVDYVVTGADGSQRTYTVTVAVAALSSEGPVEPDAGPAQPEPSKPEPSKPEPSQPADAAPEISAFNIAGVNASIGQDTITLTVPFDTRLRPITPTLVWVGAAISPLPTDPQDFTQPVVYEVTGRAGDKRRYTVTVHVAPNHTKTITHFQVFGSDATIAGSDISLTLPAGTDVTRLAPRITLSGGSVMPQSDEVQDFSRPVQYTVTAADGSVQTYTATVQLAPGSANDIMSFEIDGVYSRLQGDEIWLGAPYGTASCTWTPRIVHAGASISPADGEPQDFLVPVVYTVVAADGATRQYTAGCHPAQTSATGITRFVLQGLAASISGEDISVTLPNSASLSGLAPEITHNGVSVFPRSGVSQSFLRPLQYTSTETSGEMREYTVHVATADRLANELVELSIDGRVADIVGQQVTLTLPQGSDIRALAARIVHRGARVSPQSGATRDFSTPLTYGVFAQDGSRRDYEVKVSVAQPSGKRLTRFGLLGVDAAITGLDVNVTLPFGTDLRALVPSSLQHTGVRVSPALETIADFTRPVVYTVTAADGSAQQYTVRARVSDASENRLLSLRVLGVNAAISEDAAELWLPRDTDLHALVPTITASGVHVEPLSQMPQDFSQPVQYRVMSADGKTRSYQVRVRLADD